MKSALKPVYTSQSFCSFFFPHLKKVAVGMLCMSCEALHCNSSLHFLHLMLQLLYMYILLLLLFFSFFLINDSMKNECIIVKKLLLPKLYAQHLCTRFKGLLQFIFFCCCSCSCGSGSVSLLGVACIVLPLCVQMIRRCEKVVLDVHSSPD